MEPKWHGSYPHRRARSCLAGWVDSRFLACRRSTDDDPARPGQLGGHLLPGVSRLNTVSIPATLCRFGLLPAMVGAGPGCDMWFPSTARSCLRRPPPSKDNLHSCSAAQFLDAYRISSGSADGRRRNQPAEAITLHDRLRASTRFMGSHGTGPSL